MVLSISRAVGLHMFLHVVVSPCSNRMLPYGDDLFGGRWNLKKCLSKLLLFHDESQKNKMRLSSSGSANV